MILLQIICTVAALIGVWFHGFAAGYRHMAKIALKEVEEFGRSIGLKKDK